MHGFNVFAATHAASDIHFPQLDTKATHVSNLFQGTVTHMAPEVLMEGKTSKSADVYGEREARTQPKRLTNSWTNSPHFTHSAFGITLWELASGLTPYKGIPQVALGQIIVFKHKRPSFPRDTPPALRNLAELCWHPIASSRPSFEIILDELQKIRAELQEKPRPWLITPMGSAMGSASGPVASQDEARGSRGGPADALSTAKYNSQWVLILRASHFLGQSQVCVMLRHQLIRSHLSFL